MKAYWILWMVFGLLISCKPSGAGNETGNADGSEVSSLEKELMALHDEAMPKLNEINHLSSKLRQIRAEVPVTDEGASAYPEGLDNVLEGLKLADQAMWDWMKSYSDTKGTLTEEQLPDFFKKEMEKMQSVATGINTSIENAKTWLAAHGTDESK
jgi:hypothetical protein